MKRLIYSVIAVAVATVSCTKSNLLDAPEAQMTPISFETYTGKTPTTKAISETTLTLGGYNSSSSPAFHVTAFTPGAYTGTPYMDKDVWCTSMTQADEGTITASWDYDKTVYWPSSGGLHFFAYRGSLSPVSGSNTQFTYNVNTKASMQEDLIVAKNTSTTTIPDEGRVSLEFAHLLSRVGFTLQTTKASTESLPINVTIKHIELKGTFYPTADVDLAAGTISLPTGASASVTSYSLFDTTYPLSGTTGTYDYAYIPSPGTGGSGIYANKTMTVNNGETASDKTGTNELNRYMMLIPNGIVTGAEIYYQLPNAAEQHATATLDNSITLAQGKAYEFIFKLSTDAIEFSGEVTDWDPVTDTNIPQPEPEPEPEA